MELKLTVEPRAGYLAVCVTGEVDVSTAPRLRESLVELISEGQTRIIVDLAGVDFMDSTGLGVLVGALRRVREVSGKLVLAGARPNVQKVFDITGLTNTFDKLPGAEESA